MFYNLKFSLESYHSIFFFASDLPRGSCVCTVLSPIHKWLFLPLFQNVSEIPKNSCPMDVGSWYSLVLPCFNKVFPMYSFLHYFVPDVENIYLFVCIYIQANYWHIAYFVHYLMCSFSFGYASRKCAFHSSGSRHGWDQDSWSLSLFCIVQICGQLDL